MPKDTSHEATWNNEKIKLVALAIAKLSLSEDISQSVSQSVSQVLVSQSVQNFVKQNILKFS